MNAIYINQNNEVVRIYKNFGESNPLPENDDELSSCTLIETEENVGLGMVYQDGVFTNMPETNEQLANDVRSDRNLLLLQSDYAMHKDVFDNLTEEKQSELLTYRQSLRDITDQEGFPKNVTFPDKPSFLATE